MHSDIAIKAMRDKKGIEINPNKLRYFTVHDTPNVHGLTVSLISPICNNS